ncbi:RNA 2'-phosphotransferase [Photobacterium kishitanii]|uniref:Probable RNA 2'-phosphotransferase n=1 Tax=Photobacterium kishitanii TaxID=318456 RepID=A0A2T3KM02_9GAMM|nr:RNA 2'-phosphotransferase [Photobacterium kishitanii]PSV00725.1 hypothetical protein C9J27_06170 [Photobacterium kishitanii]
MIKKITGWIEALESKKPNKALKTTHERSVKRCIDYCATHRGFSSEFNNAAHKLQNEIENRSSDNWTIDTYEKIINLFKSSTKEINDSVSLITNESLSAAKSFFKLRNKYDYFFVVDLEMTCTEDRTDKQFLMETIEIGCAVVDSNNLKIISTFKSFVKPSKNKTLTPFCKKLTNISQDDINKADDFTTVSQNFKVYLSQFQNGLFMAWGSGDDKQLKQDAKLNTIDSPIENLDNLNLKTFFKNLGFSGKGFGLKKALNIVGLEQGEAHRALSDAINTAKLLPAMFEKAEIFLDESDSLKYLNTKTINSKGRLLTFILRHKPEDAGVTLNDQGWCDIEPLLKNLKKGQQNKITLNELFELVENDDESRFQISPDGKEIRCLQGHSLSYVKIDFVTVKPEFNLFHGTSDVGIKGIMNDKSIKRMSRNFVQLTDDIRKAKKIGARHGSPVIIKIDTRSMNRDNIAIFKSENGVFLTNNVPAMYFSEIKYNIADEYWPPQKKEANNQLVYI